MRAENNLYYSQIGYDLEQNKRVYFSGDLKNGSFQIVNSVTKEVVLQGQLTYWGMKWQRNWYVLDFSEINKPGEYSLQILDDGAIVSESKTSLHIRRDVLWNRCWYDCSLGQLDVRAANCYQEGGWRDCGSELQEVSSHIIMLEAVCDLLEDVRVPSMEKPHLLEHIVRGADYIVKCQRSDGGFVHELHHNPSVSFENCANAIAVLTRASQLLKEYSPQKSSLYLESAKKAYKFIEFYDLFSAMQENISLPIAYGAPNEMNVSPTQPRTRDLLALLQASIRLYQVGEHLLEEKLFALLDKILERQISFQNAEHSHYGHFYTFQGYDFSEKANYHCGAWDLPYKNYNQGAHKPYWVMPLFEMIDLFPGRKAISVCKEALQNFAYGFFKPACFDNPFMILPAGVYKEEGIVYFSGWYHGHAKIYGYAAALAMRFYRMFEDEDFRKIATANLQWVAGLNCEGISFIVDIGDNAAKDWNMLRGTIINGFDASKQFSISPVSKETDLPVFLDDEGGIHHCAGFISGLCAM